MLKIQYSSKFKKDYKLIKKRGYNTDLLNEVLDNLINERNLPEKNHDHLLYGDYDGHRECHIQPDWLLVYKIEKNLLILTLTRTGTHSDLF